MDSALLDELYCSSIVEGQRFDGTGETTEIGDETSGCVGTGGDVEDAEHIYLTIWRKKNVTRNENLSLWISRFSDWSETICGLWVSGSSD